jgi:hypothetical protein
MKITSKQSHQQKAVELRSRAQELKDAAGGEKAAAVTVKKEAALHTDTYEKARLAEKELLNEAAALRAAAAAKLKEAVGGRGLHALENVARGFGRMMAALSGRRVETTISLKEDPAAKAAAERLSQLAAAREEEAAAKHATAMNAHAQATAALAKMEGHERTAANHMAMAGKLLAEAGGHDRAAAFAGAAADAGEAVKGIFREVVGEAKASLDDVGRKLAAGLKEELRQGADGAWQDLRGALKGLLRAGADALLKAAASLDPKRAPAPEEAASAKADVAQKAADVAEKARVFTVDSKGVVYPPGEQGPQAGQHRGEATRMRVAGQSSRVDFAANVTSAAHDVAKALGKFDDVMKRIEYKPAASDGGPGEDVGAPRFAAGRVSFGGGEGATLAPLTGPAIDAPPKGEKKLSESLQAARWAAEAVGMDWVGKSSGELKRALEAPGAPNPLGLKRSSSPFEVKAALMARLGLPLGKNRDNVHKLELATVREEFARRDSLGLPRLSPRAELEAQLASAGLAKTATARDIAMFATVKGAWQLKDAKDELKQALGDAKLNQAFFHKASALDGAKKGMLAALTTTTSAEERRVLALDATDALEVAHGKPAATTKLIHTAETLTRSRPFNDLVKEALGFADEASYGAALDHALRAAEWTTLGELQAPSAVLAWPGPLSDADKRDVIAPLTERGARLAEELKLLSGDGLAALRDHQRFSGQETAGAQLLGLLRQVSSLSERRDFRSKELLDAEQIAAELKKSAERGQLNPALVEGIGPVLAGLLPALRG